MENEYVLSKQILRIRTFIRANIIETQKTISLKEAVEIRYCLNKNCKEFK